MTSQNGLELIQQIAANARKVNAASRERAQFVDDLVGRSRSAKDDLERIQHDTAAGNETLADTARKTANILREVESIVATLEQSVQGVGNLFEKLADFETQFSEVGAISSRIMEIAKQTRMLSFNAMIEAQHAGDSGHGFAVVATEVKALAAETSQFAGSITNVVTDLSKSVTGVTEDCNALNDDLVRGADSSRTSRDSISQISGTLDATTVAAQARSDDAIRSLTTFGELVENMAVFQNDTKAAIEGSNENLGLASKLEQVLENANDSTLRQD